LRKKLLGRFFGGRTLPACILAHPAQGTDPPEARPRDLFSVISVSSLDPWKLDIALFSSVCISNNQFPISNVQVEASLMQRHFWHCLFPV